MFSGVKANEEHDEWPSARNMRQHASWIDWRTLIQPRDKCPDSMNWALDNTGRHRHYYGPASLRSHRHLSRLSSLFFFLNTRMRHLRSFCPSFSSFSPSSLPLFSLVGHCGRRNQIPFVKNPSKVLSFLTWSRSEYSPYCFSHRQEFCPFSFLPFWFNELRLLSILFKNNVTSVLNIESDSNT